MAHTLATMTHPFARKRLDADVKLGGGRLKCMLSALLPSRCVDDLKRCVDDFIKDEM